MEIKKGKDICRVGDKMKVLRMYKDMMWQTTWQLRMLKGARSIGDSLRAPSAVHLKNI